MSLALDIALLIFVVVSTIAVIALALSMMDGGSY